MTNSTLFLPKLAAAVAGLLAISVALRATPVTVAELGIGANETVWIDSSTLGTDLHVYAGVVKLDVNGANADGFCIDPWHWSGSGTLAYNLESLAAAPKSANNSATIVPMGSSTALQIEQLWKQYYTPGISNVNAAALQLEIWERVDLAVTNGTFHLDSIDGAASASVMAEMTAMDTFLINNPGAAAANLIAATGPGQDYVIAAPAPDAGATATLLGGALLGLTALRRRFARA